MVFLNIKKALSRATLIDINDVLSNLIYIVEELKHKYFPQYLLSFITNVRRILLFRICHRFEAGLQNLIRNLHYYKLTVTKQFMIFSVLFRYHKNIITTPDVIRRELSGDVRKLTRYFKNSISIINRHI